MKYSIKYENYDIKVAASDWRYAAAIDGLIKYFSYNKIEYLIYYDEEEKEEYLLYRSDDITEKKYLEFVEYNYSEELHHKIIERKLSNDEFSEDQIKEINEKLSANTIMKKVFGKKKFDGKNKQEILDTIDKNRMDIIRETYRYKPNLYKNYCNTNQLFSEKNDYCRLLGYTLDAARKSRATGYLFDKNAFVGDDIKEFDFIPFAFLGNTESFFINDNLTIERLVQTNKEFERKVKAGIDEKNKRVDSRKALFKGIIESADFIDYDVEVIFKDISEEYFETLFIRKEAIDILKKIDDYEVFAKSYKTKKDEWINIQKDVTDCILNNIVLDRYIENFLKDNDKGYLVYKLISVNILIRGEKNMKDRLKGAYACAKKVVEAIPDNKIDAYKQKLTSSIIFKDYDRVCQILLQLSNYSDIEFGFVYDLFENFEDNKDLAYTFINALAKEKKENNENK